MESLLLYEIRRKQSSSVSKLAELAHILLNTKIQKGLESQKEKVKSNRKNEICLPKQYETKKLQKMPLSLFGVAAYC